MPPPEPAFPRPYHRPQVPTPYDSVDQVHGFLAEFLYALDSKHDREAANTDATKLDTDGRGLYEVPREEWLAQYGIKGLTIYNHLQRSKYGVVSSTAYILSPYCFDSFLTLSHLSLSNSYFKLRKGALAGNYLGWEAFFYSRIGSRSQTSYYQQNLWWKNILHCLYNNSNHNLYFLLRFRPRVHHRISNLPRAPQETIHRGCGGDHCMGFTIPLIR